MQRFEIGGGGDNLIKERERKRVSITTETETYHFNIVTGIK